MGNRITKNSIQNLSISKTSSDITAHFLTTLILLLIVYLKTNNLSYVMLVIGGGFLVDLDHLVDHFIYFKRRFILRDFLTCSALKSGRVYLFLHSWEIVFAILIVGLALDNKDLQLLALSLAVHLAIDNAQRKNPLFYFLSYRIIKKFEVPVLLTENIA